MTFKEYAETLKRLMQQVVNDRPCYLYEETWEKTIAALAFAIAALEERDKERS